MTDNEGAHGLADLSKPELARRLDRLIADRQHDGRADDITRELMVELQTHQVELDLQARELADARHILEVSRDHYARLFDLAPFGFAVFDRHGRIREINLTASQMVGRDRLRLSDTPFAVLLAAREMRRFHDHVAAVIGSSDGGQFQVLDVDLESPRPGPEPAPQALRLVSSCRDGDDGPECVSALIDITGERQLKRSKTASEHRARAILDALPAEVLVLDTSGTIVMANQAWRCGGDCPDATQETPLAWQREVGADYLAACREATSHSGTEADAIAEGVAAILERRRERFVAEYSCERGDGERWLSLTAVPLDAEGQGAVIVQIDVTDRKRAEQAAQMARQAAAYAARVNAVGVLATSLVHELAQPLNAAAFFGRSALEHLQDGEQATADRATLMPMIANAEAQLERAGAIVERLREFLRLKEMRVEPVELDPLIQHAMALTFGLASQRRVELRFVSGSVGVWLRGDSVQLEQVLVNLICNGVQAIDAADASLRRVTIETRPCTSETSPGGQTDDSSAMVQVTVSDTGPGLDPETENALFDLFAARRSWGLGLGLPISRDIVEGHAGKLWADQSSGGGASFHFTLPLGHAGED